MSANTYLEFTMTIPNVKRPAAAQIYHDCKAALPVRNSRGRLFRDHDVRVLHGLDTTCHAQAYLGTDLFIAFAINIAHG